MVEERADTGGFYSPMRREMEGEGVIEETEEKGEREGLHVVVADSNIFA